MEEKYLPIGSIVTLKDDLTMHMIVGYLNKKDDEIKDYISIYFPYGMITIDAIAYFNHEDIEKIIFSGYKNDKYKLLNDKLKQEKDKLI